MGQNELGAMVARINCRGCGREIAPSIDERKRIIANAQEKEDIENQEQSSELIKA